MSAMPRLFWAPIKSRQDLIELARTGWASFGHAVGTARIGAEADAGGGQRARVHGGGLRVAHASVMPSIVSSPTNAPSFMIGVHAAAMIKSFRTPYSR
jgi:choline dehydrogenase